MNNMYYHPVRFRITYLLLLLASLVVIMPSMSVCGAVNNNQLHPGYFPRLVEAWSEEGVDQLDVLRSLTLRRYVYSASDHDSGSVPTDPELNRIIAEYQEVMNSLRAVILAWSGSVGTLGNDAAYSEVLRVLYSAEVSSLLDSLTVAPRDVEWQRARRLVFVHLGRIELQVLGLSRYAGLSDRDFQLIGSRLVSSSVRNPVRAACRAAEEVLSQVLAQNAYATEYPDLNRELLSIPLGNQPVGSTEAISMSFSGNNIPLLERELNLALGAAASGLSFHDKLLLFRHRQEHIRQTKIIVEQLFLVESSLRQLLDGAHEPVEYGRMKAYFACNYMGSLQEIKRMLRIEKSHPVFGSYFSLLGAFTYPVNPENKTGPDQAVYSVNDPVTGEIVTSPTPVYTSHNEHELLLKSPRLKKMALDESAIRRQIDFEHQAGALARLEKKVKAAMNEMPEFGFRVTDDLAAMAWNIMRSMSVEERDVIISALRVWMPQPYEVMDQHLSYFNAMDEETRKTVLNALWARVKTTGFETAYRAAIKARRQHLADYQAAQGKESGQGNKNQVRVDDFRGIPIELVYWQERYLDWKVARCRIQQQMEKEKAITAHGIGWNGNQFHRPEPVVIHGVLRPVFGGTGSASAAFVDSLDQDDKAYLVDMGYLLVARTEADRQLHATLRNGDHPDAYYYAIHKELRQLPGWLIP